MHQPKARLRNHRERQSGRPAQEIERHRHLVGAQCPDLIDQGCDLARVVRNGMAEHRLSLAIDRAGPMQVLGHIPAGECFMKTSLCRAGQAALPCRPRPTQRSIAEPNQRSDQVSGPGGSASGTSKSGQHDSHPRSPYLRKESHQPSDPQRHMSKRNSKVGVA